MADINSQAKDLTESLKRGTGAARGLAAEISGVSGGLVGAAKHAGELAEAMAKVAKVSEGVAGPIGIAVAAVSTLIGLFTGFHEKSKEIALEIQNIGTEIERLNALSVNDVRLANEKAITLKREESIQQLKKEAGILNEIGDAVGEIGKKLDAESKKGGIAGRIAALLAPAFPKGGIHLYDYSGQEAAIRAQAQAEWDNFVAGINRQYGRERENISYASQQNSPGLVFMGDLQRQLALNELSRADAVRKQKEQGADQGMTEQQINTLVGDLNAQFDNIAQTIQNEHIKPLGDSLGRSFADSIAGGIAAGIQAGSIEKGFKVLLGGILSGLGHLMVSIGTESLVAASLFTVIVNALRSFAPEGAIAPALALIAAGGVLEGLGGAVSSGGGGGGGYGGGGYGGGGTIVDRGIINPMAPLGYAGGLSGSIQAKQPMVNHFMVVGPRDPTVQRTIQEIVTNAGKRGGV